ncbi:origin recognition complex subunit 6 isoform X1 [Callorhinchus milii]|uniref:Origin recognition complex subunit 6 n=1 Tax=Callorhinchus milii TaxID=7868 RepID=A0A4W3JE39_CALMI|nr:origin recognition complex subunit 6 isoform X1 [Callorhinchus milii]|eukprot:gi/632944609/ref/XP_007887599.1/ PREDICTED: origin recognition complex subunit 6 isoform X1 [Callorhinchus milii]
MEVQVVGRLAPKLGIASRTVTRKAEEYLRLSEVKCTGFSTHITATSYAVMCLDLAASSLKHPIDKEFVVKLSGLNKKVYQSHLKALESMLGLDSQLGIRDLAVLHGCMEAVEATVNILQRYEASLSEAQQGDLDFSKPLFTTAALFTACKCMKIKVDKNKLMVTSGVKKIIFDRLCSQMEKFGQLSCKESAGQSNPNKRQRSLLEELEKKEEINAMEPKQENAESNAAKKEDYKEWKRRILENAAKKMDS